ncbi:hypothetical protein [Rahnella aceris]|uniref:Uncharacterized protein n=1 Tax=Rahnella sp. (strain Y9602) TaxID=2703885 RepID=A0ABW6CEF1_RAHSY
MKSNDDEVIGYLKKIKPRSRYHKVISRDNFINGSISKATFTDDGVDFTLWVISIKGLQSHADSESQLIQNINSAIKQDGSKLKFFNNLFNISGIIALIIVSCVVYLSITKPGADVPEFLKTSMLTILGFYFGGLVSGKTKNMES